jgi:hypothetical protein
MGTLAPLAARSGDVRSFLLSIVLTNGICSSSQLELDSLSERDGGEASLNRLSKAGVDSLRSRFLNSTIHERTAVDHLFLLGVDLPAIGFRRS